MTRLHLYGFSFTPKLIPTLVTIFLLPILISLGFWQLHRAEKNHALLASYQARFKLAPLELADVSANWEQFKYYPIKLIGYYDNQHSILLDNKIYQHRIGYQVLTPFTPENSNRIILINRGWIPQGPSRQQLPIIPAVSGQQIIQGIIYPPPVRTFLLGKDIEKGSWPLVSQAIEIPHYENLLGRSLYPFVILLSPKNANGFVREWTPVTVSPYKNLGYAVQWFSLALALIIIFIVVNTHREKT